ncbi:secreted protein, partial [marine sediment metagenome]
MKIPSLYIAALYLLAIVLVSSSLSSCLSTLTSTAQKTQLGDELLATSSELINEKDTVLHSYVASFLKEHT